MSPTNNIQLKLQLINKITNIEFFNLILEECLENVWKYDALNSIINILTSEIFPYNKHYNTSITQMSVINIAFKRTINDLEHWSISLEEIQKLRKTLYTDLDITNYILNEIVSNVKEVLNLGYIN